MTAAALVGILYAGCKDDEKTESKQQVRIYGSIVDDNGNPIANATVTIDDQKCLTGADGMYEVFLPSEPRYVVVYVSLPGHTCTIYSYQASDIGRIYLKTATNSRHDARCRLNTLDSYSCQYTVCN